MCGRFTLRAGPAEVARAFDLDPAGLPDFGPRYNIAPTQPVAIVRRRAKGRELAMVRWGLVPGWVEDPSDWPTLVNARSETVDRKPSFRDAFERRRCLVPADGFYEWVSVGGRKRPYFVHRPDDGLFAFAGLWDRWRGGTGEAYDSCTILTAPAGPDLAPIHPRVPVILTGDLRNRWLDPAADPSELGDHLRSLPEGILTFHAVRPVVNRPDHDAPDCVEPLV